MELEVVEPLNITLEGIECEQDFLINDQKEQGLDRSEYLFIKRKIRKIGLFRQELVMGT